MIQIIAGVKVPEKLKFGNEEHIKIVRQVEKRLELINEGIDCGFCGRKMTAWPNIEDGYIDFECACGEGCMTDLDGDGII